jgi:hypothetical protein
MLQVHVTSEKGGPFASKEALGVQLGSVSPPARCMWLRNDCFHCRGWSQQLRVPRPKSLWKQSWFSYALD